MEMTSSPLLALVLVGIVLEMTAARSIWRHERSPWRQQIRDVQQHRRLASPFRDVAKRVLSGVPAKRWSQLPMETARRLPDWNDEYLKRRNTLQDALGLKIARVMDDIRRKEATRNIETGEAFNWKRAFNLDGDSGEEAAQTFHLFDMDHNGFISAPELRQMMHNLGSTLTDEQFFKMFQKIDEDGDGRINYNEFLTLGNKNKMIDTDTDTDSGEEAAQTFHLFDLDYNGFISAPELRQVMRNLDSTLTDEQVFKMFKESDVDGDDRINYKEFLKMKSRVFS